MESAVASTWYDPRFAGEFPDHPAAVYRYQPAAVRRPAWIQIDREVVRLARFMDTLFRVPVLGWRFGLNTILDLVPGIGDTVTSVICLYMLVCAFRYRVPKVTTLRMAVNIAVYYVGGLAPFVGDVFATWWKPNKRNLALLARYATASPDEHNRARTSDIIFFCAVAFVLISLLVATLVFGYLALRLAVSTASGMF